MDGFGPRSGVTLPPSFVALIYHTAVEDVDADGIASECVGGEVDGSECGSGGEVVDGDVETGGEGCGAGEWWFGGEVVEDLV